MPNLDEFDKVMRQIQTNENPKLNRVSDFLRQKQAEWDSTIKIERADEHFLVENRLLREALEKCVEWMEEGQYSIFEEDVEEERKSILELSKKALEK
jgi:hypothetical protein